MKSYLVYNLLHRSTPSSIFIFSTILAVRREVELIRKFKVSCQLIQKINAVSFVRKSAVFIFHPHHKGSVLGLEKQRQNLYNRISTSGID